MNIHDGYCHMIGDVFHATNGLLFYDLPCISSMDIRGKVGSSTLVIVAVVEINYAFDMDI